MNPNPLSQSTSLSCRPNYDLLPTVQVRGHSAGVAWQGWESCMGVLKNAALSLERPEGAPMVTVDCYPGVYLEEIARAIEQYWPQARVVRTDQAYLDEVQLEARLAPELSEDRVFGRLSTAELSDYLEWSQVRALQAEIAALALEPGVGAVVLLGTGASLIHPGHLGILADLPRWERQLRLRRGESNWRAHNPDEDMLRKYKRGYFWEWRVADRHKRTLLPEVQFLLDTTEPRQPRLLEGDALREGLRHTATRPFRVVPYFDEGAWGGQWMKSSFGLDPAHSNYAWGFDGVPEENSLRLAYGEVVLEIPSINLVFAHPQALLGEAVFRRFGAEFPIRFDLLDTLGGQHLSLQVHPTLEYIREHFGMAYTQDESYYLLEVGEGGCVYLGLKSGVTLEDFMDALRVAQAGGPPLDEARYLNAFPVRPHDHVLIPAGTVHGAGKNTLVLEVSATPYIFTFKLYDWGRLGLDGLPRPLHLEHGAQVIALERDTEWVGEQLLNRQEEVAHGEGWREERTGLHELEFIETRRHTFRSSVTHHTAGSVQMLNLVQGEEAVVESPEGAFAPFVVHFAETFIVPAAVGVYTVRPHGISAGCEIATLRASVRL